MTREVYRYVFAPEAPIEDVEASLVLALWAAESLHGEAQMRLDAAHAFDAAKRVCAIDACAPLGADLNKLFVGFLQRELVEGAFRVERVGEPAPPAAA